MIIWYNNEREKTIVRRILQAKAYVHTNQINLELTNTENIRKQVRGLKEIIKRATKLNEDDIRIYFMQNTI